MNADRAPLARALLPIGAQLLAPVLEYCRAHPYHGENVDFLAQDAPIRRDEHGTLTLERDEAPVILHVSAVLLDAADPASLSFDAHTGTLTLHVCPRPLHYLALYQAPALLAVTFRLIGAPSGAEH